MVDRTQLLVFIILGTTLIASRPYDPRGAFVLLQSMEQSLASSLPGISGVAMHANMLASLTGNRHAREHARETLADVVADLERMYAALPPPG